MRRKYRRLLHQRAAASRGRYPQHREIYMGAAALVCKWAEERQRWVFGIITGANRKVKPGIDPDRLCAEGEIFDLAFKGGWDHILMIVVHGPHQPDDSTRVDLGTIIMCGYCRNDVRSLKGVCSLVTDETLFISINVDNPRKHIRKSVGELLWLCGGDNDPAIKEFLPRSTRAWHGELHALYDLAHPSP